MIDFTAGYYRNGTNLIPCYWINAQKYDLGALPNNGEAMAIKVYDGKVYTAGYFNTSNNNKNTCYWLNQERNDIYTVNTTYSARNTNGTSFNETILAEQGRANAIVVK